MVKSSRFLIYLSALLACCSSADKKTRSEFDYFTEFMKMEERGQIDSVIMDQGLAIDDPEIQSTAAGTVGIVRDREFLFRLGELCHNHEKRVREAAIFALGEVGDPAAIGPLAAVLHAEDSASQIRAIEAMGKIGDETAAPFIRPFLRKSDDQACEAALALWRMSDSSSLGDLRWLAQNSSGRGLYGAIYAMSRMLPDSCVEEFSGIFERFEGADGDFAEISAVAARGLALSGDSAAVLHVYDNYYNILPRPAKIELINSMGQLGLGRADLEKILEETADSGLKRAIILSLGQIGNPKSGNVIDQYTGDASLQVRLAAIAALPEIDKKSPTDTLKKLESDRNWQVRAEVARSLGKIKSNSSLKQLRLMLEDNDDRVKAAVIEGLGEFPIKRNIDIIKAALNGSSDYVVRSVAADVLGKSKDSVALEILLETAERNVTTDEIDFARGLVVAVGNFVDTTEAGVKAREVIEKYLHHQNRVVRQDAFAALGKFAPGDFDPGAFDAVYDDEHYKFLRDLNGAGVVAVMETSRGTIKIKLEPDTAVRTVANFVKLARRGFYDNLTFHRVVQDFVIQGGCPRGDGWGGPGYMIREEINPLKFKRGTIGMATSGRDTGGSQFFICLSGQPHLDGRYTAFGNVIEGGDILDKIEIGDIIKSIKIESGRYQNES
jgi:peptidyl-prolyl cis-trans isomerase B (cyclophilin B)